VENLLRQDLTAVEEAEGLQRLKDDQQYTDEQLSGVIGRARTTLSDILLINRLPAEIRDECRGDRTVSKNTLIEIARRKQERGMVTAWEAYKEKVARQAEGRKKGTATPPTAPELKKWFDKTRDRISDADTANWSEDERFEVNESLAALRETIDAFLASGAEAEEDMPSRELS